eukprot:348582-Pleurochrysis_carterae.AAC.5
MRQHRIPILPPSTKPFLTSRQAITSFLSGKLSPLSFCAGSCSSCWLSHNAFGNKRFDTQPLATRTQSIELVFVLNLTFHQCNSHADVTATIAAQIRVRARDRDSGGGAQPVCALGGGATSAAFASATGMLIAWTHDLIHTKLKKGLVKVGARQCMRCQASMTGFYLDYVAEKYAWCCSAAGKCLDPRLTDA